MRNVYTPGTQLFVADKKITQEQINKYADASDDHNPLHIDPAFAETTFFKGTIAHGLLSAAFINEMMVKYFGMCWERSGDVSMTFLSPVRPGDTIKTIGNVVGTDDSGCMTIDIQCTNQHDKKVIVGCAYVTVPKE